MRRRWLLLASLLATLLALTGSVLWTLQLPPPLQDYITQANCERLVPGVSRAEVHAILGGPGWSPPCGLGIAPGEHTEFWEGRVGVIRVDFGDEGRVLRAQYGPLPDSERSARGRLRAWLGW